MQMCCNIGEVEGATVKVLDKRENVLMQVAWMTTILQNHTDMTNEL